MDSEPSMVVLERVKSMAEAHIIAAVLEEAGIPAYVGGDDLMDEFTMSQRLMGLGVEVQVPGEQLEEAREALREARSRGSMESPEDGDDAGQDPSSG